MASRMTYTIGCPCQSFVFTLTTPEIVTADQCNCSMCHRKGYLWVHPLSFEDVNFTKGGVGDLADYTFGSGTMHHLFCPACAAPLIGTVEVQGLTQLGVNARAIKELDIQHINKRRVNGLVLGEPWTPYKHRGSDPAADIEGGVITHGSCHCGALTVAVKTKPLDETYTGQVDDGSCSFYARNAHCWISLKKEQVVLSGDEDVTGRYVFDSQEDREVIFCRVCGVHVTAWKRETDEHWVNLRALEGVDLVTVMKRGGE